MDSGCAACIIAAHCIARPEFKDWRPAWRSFEPEMKAILAGGKANQEKRATEDEGGNAGVGGRARTIHEQAKARAGIAAVQRERWAKVKD
jgi:hypothetical protein